VINGQSLAVVDKIPFGEMMAKWYNSMEDHVDLPATVDISAFSQPGSEAYSDDPSEEFGKEASTETAMEYRSTYQKFIYKSPAYQWLLASLCRELILASTHPNTRDTIRHKILSILPHYPRISRKRPAAALRIRFALNWDPRQFVETQGHKEQLDDVIERSITLTGSTKDAQALTCKEYLCQVWPASGEDIMELVKKIVSSAPSQLHTCMFTFFRGASGAKTDRILGDLSDGTKVIAWIDVPMLIVEVLGTGDSLAEIGEQLAWLGASLRSSPYDTGVASCVPFIPDTGVTTTSGLASGESIKPLISCFIDFHIEPKEDSLEPSNGQCWHNLFKNPLVVKGYPILRRPQPHAGLETSLKIMIALTQARFVTTFAGKIFIKGLSTMLIPTASERHMVTWHLLFNSNGSHISYTSSQIQNVSGFYPANITTGGLENCRHIIGWCSNVQNHTGRTFTPIIEHYFPVLLTAA
jgi:hypothetical protein